MPKIVPELRGRWCPRVAPQWRDLAFVMKKPILTLLPVLLFDTFPAGRLAAPRFSSLSGRLDV
jgi:hypothetical protein